MFSLLTHESTRQTRRKSAITASERREIRKLRFTVDRKQFSELVDVTSLYFSLLSKLASAMGSLIVGKALLFRTPAGKAIAFDWNDFSDLQSQFVAYLKQLGSFFRHSIGRSKTNPFPLPRTVYTWEEMEDLSILQRQPRYTALNRPIFFGGTALHHYIVSHWDLLEDLPLLRIGFGLSLTVQRALHIICKSRGLLVRGDLVNPDQDMMAIFSQSPVEGFQQSLWPGIVFYDIIDGKRQRTGGLPERSTFQILADAFPHKLVRRRRRLPFGGSQTTTFDEKFPLQESGPSPFPRYYLSSLQSLNAIGKREMDEAKKRVEASLTGDRVQLWRSYVSYVSSLSPEEKFSLRFLNLQMGWVSSVGFDYERELAEDAYSGHLYYHEMFRDGDLTPPDAKALPLLESVWEDILWPLAPDRTFLFWAAGEMMTDDLFHTTSFIDVYGKKQMSPVGRLYDEYLDVRQRSLTALPLIMDEIGGSNVPRPSSPDLELMFEDVSNPSPEEKKESIIPLPFLSPPISSPPRPTSTESHLALLDLSPAMSVTPIRSPPLASPSSISPALPTPFISPNPLAISPNPPTISPNPPTPIRSPPLTSPPLTSPPLASPPLASPPSTSPALLTPALSKVEED